MEVKNNKIIAEVGSILEVSREFASKFIYCERFKENSKFFVKVYDRRKSGNIYYILDFMIIKEDLIDKDDYLLRYRTQSKRFSRDELIKAIQKNQIIKVIDEVDFARIHLYSEFKFRWNK